MNSLLFKTERPQEDSEIREPIDRVTAVDVGTNSIHAIIVDVYSHEQFEVVDQIKEQVGFANEGRDLKRLDEAAILRGVAAMQKIKTLSIRRGVENFVAYATSAVREAENGGDFIQRVIDEVGIKILPIPGKKEARLIGIAVRQALALSDIPVLIMDIGGGSTEFIIANNKAVFFTESFKLGASRMYAQFVSSDPISTSEKTKLKNHFKKELEKLDVAIKRFKPHALVVTSGTLETVSTIIYKRKSLDSAAEMNGFSFSSSDLNVLYKEILKMNRMERAKVPGLEEKRLNNIIPGLILARSVTKKFRLDNIMFSAWALREGMVLEYIERHKSEHQEVPLYNDIRHKSIYELLRKCQWHEKHSVQVAKIALKLFDDLKETHRLSSKDRELLKFASLLHDIGYYISQRKHHKHALYLILNSDLKGFHPTEVDIMAHVARYHRRSTPKERHELYQRLDLDTKERINKLAGFLRVADGLDRSHFQNVKHICGSISGEEVVVQLQTEGDAALEMWGAKRKCELFESMFGKKLRIERVAVLPAADEVELVS